VTRAAAAIETVDLTVDESADIIASHCRPESYLSTALWPWT